MSTTYRRTAAGTLIAALLTALSAFTNLGTPAAYAWYAGPVDGHHEVLLEVADVRAAATDLAFGDVPCATAFEEYASFESLLKVAAVISCSVFVHDCAAAAVVHPSFGEGRPVRISLYLTEPHTCALMS